MNTIIDSTGSQAEFGFTGLVIKDSNFIQLPRPFPFYVRDFQSLPNRKKPSKVVKKMNARLYKWLE